MLKGIFSKIYQRLIGSHHKETPSAVVCLGDLPHKLRCKIRLRNIWQSLGLNNKQLNQAMKQIDGHKNN